MIFSMLKNLLQKRTTNGSTLKVAEKCPISKILRKYQHFNRINKIKKYIEDSFI